MGEVARRAGGGFTAQTNKKPRNLRSGAFVFLAVAEEDP
jgi:hypothetical protein